MEEPAPSNINSEKILLYILDHDQVIELYGQEKYILGRIVDDQEVAPDVDLSSFNAYDEGVSRQHAIIKIIPNQTKIIDLGSSNGTRINGQKIIAQVDYPIKDGDVVTLGKLRIQIIVKS